MEQYKKDFPTLSEKLLEEIRKFCVERYRPDSEEFDKRFRAICVWESDKMANLNFD